ncbi:MAG: lipase, partial [Muribaculaceae bacterium]|nr:lipase [Muribaculaceae bacterium]
LHNGRTAPKPVDWAQFARYEADNQKVIASGDSIVALFFGDSITDSWATMEPGFFKANNYLGRGISGQTTYQFLSRFREDAVNLWPQIIVLNGATNDIAENSHPYSEERTVGNIRSMIEIAKANGIEVILTSTLPSAGFKWNRKITDAPKKIRSLNNRLRQLAEEYDLCFVDYYPHLLADDGYSLNPAFSPDGVHPNLAGYKIMEQLIFDQIRDLQHWMKENKPNN